MLRWSLTLMGVVAVIAIASEPAPEAPDDCCTTAHRTAQSTNTDTHPATDTDPATATATATETDTDSDSDCPGPCTSCTCCMHAPAAPALIAATPVRTFSRISFADPAPADAPDGVAFRIDRPPRG